MPLLRGIAVAGDSGDRTAERPALWTGLFEFQFEFPPKFVERGVLAAQVGELVFRLDGADCAPVLFYFDVEYDRSVEPRDVTQQGNQLLLVLNFSLEVPPFRILWMDTPETDLPAGFAA